MLIFGVVLLHDNAYPHTSTHAHTRPLLELFNWTFFDHPPYSPVVAPSDYHLFTYMTNWLRSQCFNNNEKLMEDAKRVWLSSQVVDFFDTVIQKLIPQSKCVNSACDYAEK
jgi:histone-lysine N-methyltransferase SETMAR